VRWNSLLRLVRNDIVLRKRQCLLLFSDELDNTNEIDQVHVEVTDGPVYPELEEEEGDFCNLYQ